MPKPDLFAKVPEFLAAFDHILKNGFFEEIIFNTGGKRTEGRIYGCFITAAGCVPSNRKYAAKGCGAIIDPHAIIASCRALAKGKKVKDISTKIETGDWQLYDTEGINVIGSKGTRTELSIFIDFKT